MRKLLAASVLFAVKILSHLFYKTESGWVGEAGPHPWKDARLFVLLNHTSLFEPLFFSAVPFSVLWRVSGNFIFPGAQKTINRPLVGLFWKLFSRNLVSVTRTRDKTWDAFLEIVRTEGSKYAIAIAPEGRMKRKTGLDSENRPMSIRGGIADILGLLTPEGDMILAYSGGLHHVQHPGDGLPKLFQTIRIRFERVPIKEFQDQFGGENSKSLIVDELKRRQELHCGALEPLT